VGIWLFVRVKKSSNWNIMSAKKLILAKLISAVFGISLITASIAETTTSASMKDVDFGISFQSPLFARLGPATLTQSELDASLALIPEEHVAAFLLDRTRVSERLDQLLGNRLVALDAIENGILEDQMVQAKLYHAMVEVLASLRRERLRAEQDLNFEALARERFLADPTAFRTPETFDFSHILIRFQGRSEAEAARLMLAVYDRLHDGEPFDELVAVASDDPAQPENGYTGVLADDLDEDFARVLVRLDPGSAVVGPFRSAHGWHLLRLNARHPGREMVWEEAREHAIEQARKQHMDRMEQRYRRRLADGHELEMAPDALKDLYERYDLLHHFDLGD
jgi:peptidyl-prolyl cis-trans isomerase C